MSRIIVRNIPKFVKEKELKEHFISLGDITDCRVVRNKETNESRRFGFVGFRDNSISREARKKYDNTYFGVSKIRIDFARTQEEEERPKQKTNQKNKIQQKTKQKFNQYKKVVMEGVKKSWDDLVVPQNIEVENQDEKEIKQETKKSKKQKIEEKRKRKQVQKKQFSNLKEQKMKQPNIIKAIKAPKLSEKNKKFINKPLNIDETRLYITNIPYTLTEDQLRKGFQKYGNIKKIKLPVEYDGKTKGFAFITYQIPGQALRAFNELDNKVMFGRILHIKPAVEDIGEKIKTAKEQEYVQKIKELYGDTEEEKTSYKKQKKRQMRQKMNDTTSWNTLFLNPNTVLQRMSSKLGITKSQILLSDNLAPKMALAQAQVLQQTKQWMINQQINVQFLKLDRDACERSKKVLLLKNLNYRVSQNDLQQLMNFYGIVNKLLLAPNRSIAIVQYQNSQFAQNALEKLQNTKFKNSFLYLQYAPTDMIKEKEVQKKIQQLKEEIADAEELTKVVYVKNLNFQTNQEMLEQFIQKVESPKSVKIIQDKNRKSMGYGFIQFKSSQQAQKVIKRLQNQILDGHRILLSMSKKRIETQNYEKIKELKEKINKKQIKSTKLVVRNLAFQATKQDVKDLFKHFGSLKTIRLPKKMNGQHRGFCFVEFDTSEEAALAKQALSSTHLYGRKFVIEYQQGGNQKTE